jgi:hypothetical protein
MDILSLLYLAKIYLPLSILIIILFFHIASNDKKNKFIKYGILLTAAILFSTSSYSTIATYNLWKEDPFSKFLLPSYDASYFYGYAFSHFWKSFIIILIISFFWAAFLSFLKKYYRDRLLDKSEIYLGFFTALAVGFPNFIIYIFILFAIFLFHQLIQNIILKKSQPIAISPSMIISAIIVILYGNNILIKFGLDVLKV